MSNQVADQVAFKKEATSNKKPLPSKVLLQEGFGHFDEEFGEKERSLDAGSAIAEAESILGLNQSQPEIIEGQIENSAPTQEISSSGSLIFSSEVNTFPPAISYDASTTTQQVSEFAEGYKFIKTTSEFVSSSLTSALEGTGKVGAEVFSAVAGLKDYLAPVEPQKKEDPAVAQRKAEDQKKIEAQKLFIAHQRELAQGANVVEQEKEAREEVRLEVVGMTADQKNGLLGIQKGVRIIIGIAHRIILSLKSSEQKKAASKPKDESNFKLVCKRSSKQAAAGMFDKRKQDGNSFTNAIAGAG